MRSKLTSILVVASTGGARLRRAVLAFFAEGGGSCALVGVKLGIALGIASGVGLSVGLGTVGCASGHEFWNHVVDEPVSKPTNREAGTDGDVKSTQVVHVAFNDGSTRTDVDVPVLSSGQVIVIDQKGRAAGKDIGLVPLPPTDADKPVVDAYLKTGQPVAGQAPEVSIVKTHAMVQKLVKQGNYALALEYISQVLKKYPNHPESLRIKGSLLLKMGEREAALDAYRKAQAIQPNARVGNQIQELEKSLQNR